MKRGRKVLLIDGMSLAYRAFFALPVTMTTTGGLPTNAVYGFTSMLLKVLDEEKPDAVIVALDGPRADLERTREFPQYKAQRPAMPEELRGQIEMIVHLLGHMNIPTVTAPGHEADDIIGTIAKQVSGRGGEAVVVTGDRDTLQLVEPGVTVLMTGKGITETVTYDRKAVQDRYGVPPESLPDIAGLKGDASDNIPGVPGIGEKGACALIQQYGSLEGLYDHLDEITGPKRKSSLQDNRDLAFLSRKLSVLDTDVPLELDVDSVSFADWDKHAVLDYLSALEFRTLAGRFLEMYGDQLPAEAAGHGSGVSFQLVDTGHEDAVRSFVAAALAAGSVGMSVVLTGSGYCDLELKAVAISCGEKVMLAREGAAFKAASELVSSDRVEKWMHDAKPAIEGMDKAGMRPSRISFDTAIAAYLENPSLGSYNVRDIWERNLGGEVRIEGLEAEPEPDEQPSLLDLAADDGWYEKDVAAALEAARVLHLKPVLSEKLEALEMSALESELELPLMHVLKDMEEAGVALDASVLRSLAGESAAALARLEVEIFELAGHEFKISSTRQLAQVLFDELQLPPTKKTKTGYSTDASVLEGLRGTHNICDRVIEYREQSKLKSTYFDVLPALICPATGRLHCQYNQTSTTTGRLSSSNPNLQNIPVRTEAGRKIRSAFVAAEPGWKIIVADYSQIELRVLAHESRDPLLLSAFEDDRDIHTETASRVFGVPAEEVDGEMRRMAKVVNFGIVYGMGYYGLSSRLGISMEDATVYIDAYFDTYQGVREYRDWCIAEAAGRGYATTILGRRRFIPELASGNRQTRELGERLAINTPLQGSAADIIKKAMVDVHRAMSERAMRSRMTMQIHDELIIEGPAEEAGDAAAIVTSRMSGAVELAVPLKVDSGIYDDWGQAKQ